MAARRSPREGQTAAGKPAARRGAGRAADDAAARAKRAGAIGPNGSDGRRSLRDSAILARAATRTPQREIGEEFGVSGRTVRAVLERARHARSPLEERPMQLIEDALRAYLRQRADLLVLAWVNAEKNSPVALGALRAAGDNLDRYLV